MNLKNEFNLGKYKDIIFDSETTSGVKSIKNIRENFKSDLIVFATGCFDVPQPGHAIFTEQIRIIGERNKSNKSQNVIVILGLGRDSTLKKLKADRPIIPEINRAYILASYKNVDYVLLNNKKIIEGKIDFVGVVKNLKPDIFVLNDDDSAILEKKRLCENMKIKFLTVKRETAKFLKPTSSTQIIEKIKSLT